jgi:hypothetical protein
MLLLALIGKAVNDAAGSLSKVEKFLERLIALNASLRNQ